MTSDEERDRGILSPADRKYLQGGREYDSEGTEYNTKRRIRKRVREGILDFTLLFNELEHEEREKIFGSNLTPLIELDDDLAQGMRDALAFILEGAGGAALLDEHRPKGLTSEQLLERAIGRLARQYGYFPRRIDMSGIEIDAERLPWNLEEGLEQGEELPPEALAFLMEEYDEIDTIEVQELLRSMISQSEE